METDSPKDEELPDVGRSTRSTGDINVSEEASAVNTKAENNIPHHKGKIIREIDEDR